MTANTVDNKGIINTDFSNIITGDMGTGKVSETNQTLVSKILSYVKDNLGPALDESPKLRAPNTGSMSNVSIMGMDEETVMMMLGTETAEVEKKGAVNAIKNRAKLREAENDKLIKNLKEQAEKLENQSVWDKFCKVFKIVASVVGVVAAVAGAVFSGGSTLAIAAAIIGGALAAENLISTATDGKIGLGALCTKIFGEEAGPWVAMGISLALTVATMGMGIGAAAKGATEGVNATVKAVRIGTQIAGGVSNVGAGIAGIGSAVNSYNITQLKVSNKEMEAILAKLRQLSDQDTKHLEEVMETQNELVNGVKDVIESVNAAEQAIVTA